MKLQAAGAFVLVDGSIAFQAGPDQTGDQIGIVRIGGHIEPGETPWECAQREAMEEASLRITSVDAPSTYCLSMEEPPKRVGWAGGSPCIPG
jgi:8-oxo-dGTP pyrophosphatase MutT (NUDIX family)